MNKRITYSKEFKQEAVRQLEKGDKPAASWRVSWALNAINYNDRINA